MVAVRRRQQDRAVTRSRLQQGLLWLVILSVVPYLTLKVLWLGGSTIGLSGQTAHAQMSSTRMVVGNVLTVLMVVLAVGLAVALTRRRGTGVPAWAVLVLGVGAAGLLAPIVLGLPVGLALQLVATGGTATGRQGAQDGQDGQGELAPWVFGAVYGGFLLLGVALALLLALHVLDRWGRVVTAPPRPPGAWVAAAGAVGMLPFGAAMLYWGLAGPGGSGPQGMETLTQRTVLVVTGVLAFAAFVVPFAAEPARAPVPPRAAWLVLVVGCASTALQGPAQLLLAQDGDVQPLVAVVALLASPTSCVLGLTVLQSRRRDLAQSPDVQEVAVP